MLKPRAILAGLGTYHSPIISREGLSLDLNESMAGCSPRVLERLRALSASDLSLYPQRETGERMLADFLGVLPQQVLLTNGMDDALFLFFQTYLGPEKDAEKRELLFADPTFVMYPLLGQATGAHMERVQSPEDFSFPVDRMLERINSNTRLIAIANPNNPTGLAVSREDLIRIVAAAPDSAVLIDEAYFEFCGTTLLGDLKTYPNLFVARTFSKAYGLAGLRLGVLIGPDEQIDFMRRFSVPFNVNSVALACLESALGDQEFVRNQVAQVKEQRDRLQRLFAELGLRYWPSEANFVLVNVGAKVKEFVDFMRRRKILVRNCSSNPGCKGCVRITVPTSPQMNDVSTAIRQAVAEIR